MFTLKKGEPLRDSAERTSGGERRVREQSGCFEVYTRWRVDLDSELVIVFVNCLKCIYVTRLRLDQKEGNKELSAWFCALGNVL